MGVVIVTGTGTGVGKTVTCAALAACNPGDVAYVKLAQTGLDDGRPGDAAEFSRLARRDLVHEFARYPDPLLPRHAAMLSGRPVVGLADAVRRIIDLDALHDTVLVDGTGGLLVPYTSDDRWTLVDLGHAVDARFVAVIGVTVDMVGDASLLTSVLHEELSESAAVVIGNWPTEADAAARYGLFDVQGLARRSELAGVLPAGLAVGPNFRRRARAALAPAWGGTLDTRGFVARQRP